MKFAFESIAIALRQAIKLNGGDQNLQVGHAGSLIVSRDSSNSSSDQTQKNFSLQTDEVATDQEENSSTPK